MSIDKNNPAGASDDQTGAQTESLESAEIEAVDLENISGGMTVRPGTAPLTGDACATG